MLPNIFFPLQFLHLTLFSFVNWMTSGNLVGIGGLYYQKDGTSPCRAKKSALMYHVSWEQDVPRILSGYKYVKKKPWKILGFLLFCAWIMWDIPSGEILPRSTIKERKKCISQYFWELKKLPFFFFSPAASYTPTSSFTILSWKLHITFWKSRTFSLSKIVTSQ